MRTPSDSEASRTERGSLFPLQQQQQQQNQENDTEMDAGELSRWEGLTRGPLDLRIFEYPHLRHRRPSRLDCRVQQQKQQWHVQQFAASSVETSAEEQRNRGATSRRDEGVVPLEGHGGDSCGSPAASTAATAEVNGAIAEVGAAIAAAADAAVAEEASEGAATPLGASAPSSWISSPPKVDIPFRGSERVRTTMQQPLVGPTSFYVAAKPLQGQQYQLQQQRWTGFLTAAAGKVQQLLRLLQQLQVQLQQHPSHLVALPTLLLATLPTAGSFCVVAAGLLPVRVAPSLRFQGLGFAHFS